MRRVFYGVLGVFSGRLLGGAVSAALAVTTDAGVITVAAKVLHLKQKRDKGLFHAKTQSGYI